MLSSTLHNSCVCSDSSRLRATGRLPRPVSRVGGAVPPPQPMGCGGDYFFGASEGAQSPRQLELGAQQPLSRPSRHALTAPSWPHRCPHAARERRQRQRLDSLPPWPRCRRRQHRRRPLHRQSELPTVRCARCDCAARVRTLTVPNRCHRAPPPPPWHANLAPTSPSTDTPLLASLPQGLMPTRRRHRAPSGPPQEGCGPPGGPLTALNGRRARVVCAGDGASTHPSAGGVRGARLAPAAARARAQSDLAGRSYVARLPPLAVGARLQPRGAMGSSERLRAGRGWLGGGWRPRRGRAERWWWLWLTVMCRCSGLWCCCTYLWILEIVSRNISQYTCDPCVPVCILEYVVDLLCVGNR